MKVGNESKGLALATGRITCPLTEMDKTVWGVNLGEWGVEKLRLIYYNFEMSIIIHTGRDRCLISTWTFKNESS